MFYEELKQIIGSVLQQGLSGQPLTGVLTANVNPAEIYVSDDMLVTDSYFSLLHFATGRAVIGMCNAAFSFAPPSILSLTICRAEYLMKRGKIKNIEACTSGEQEYLINRLVEYNLSQVEEEQKDSFIDLRRK